MNDICIQHKAKMKKKNQQMMDDATKEWRPKKGVRIHTKKIRERKRRFWFV